MQVLGLQMTYLQRMKLICRIEQLFPTIAADFKTKFDEIEHAKVDLETKLWDTIEAYDLPKDTYL
jgi:hypothetical protein